MARKSKMDDIALFYEYNIYLPQKLFYLGSTRDDEVEEIGINFQSAENIVKALTMLDSIDDDRPIQIIANSPGGDWYHGMAIYDRIKVCQHPVHITCYGYVMSMMSVILQAAEKRTLSANARMMIHYGESGYIGHNKVLYKIVDELKKVDEQMEQILLDRIREIKPTFTLKELKNLLNFDTYLTPEEAIKLGLCDNILQKDNE